MYKLNRRITVRRYTTAKNDFGGLVSVQTGSWSKWAQANERFGTSSNTLQQQVWQYDQRFITRFEVERPTKSNDLIEYEGRLYRVESVGIDSEGFKAFEIIRCIRIDTNINSAAPVDNDSIQLINYTGVSNETTFTNSSLIGKTPFAAFKDGIKFTIGGVNRAIKDSVGVYVPNGVYNKQDTGTVTTNGTSPTGTTNHRYSFEYGQNGRSVTLHYVANWPNTGTGISTFTIPLPADCPTPQLPNGISGANVNIVPGFALLQTATTSETTARGILKVNAANTGYEIEVTAGSGNYRIANVSLTYFLTPP